MKINTYFNLLVLVVTLLMFSTPLLINIQAHDLDPVQYDIGENQIVDKMNHNHPGSEKDTTDGGKSAETNAVADAKRDVKAHINKTLWFTAGCFFPIIGPVYSQRNDKTIPSARFLGKSAKYVAFYTDTYKIEMKKQRYNWALMGCIVGSLTDTCLIGILINRYNN